MIKHVLVAGAVLAAAIPTIVVATEAIASTTPAKTITRYVTFYGRVDNSPSGNRISGGLTGWW
jgi:hypothetical protein